LVGVIQRHGPPARIPSNWLRLGFVALIPVAAVTADDTVNLHYPRVADTVPFLGLVVWAVHFATAGIRKPERSLLPEAAKGSVFLRPDLRPKL
jgi:hypothetical protein